MFAIHRYATQVNIMTHSNNGKLWNFIIVLITDSTLACFSFPALSLIVADVGRRGGRLP